MISVSLSTSRSSPGVEKTSSPGIASNLAAKPAANGAPSFESTLEDHLAAAAPGAAQRNVAPGSVTAQESRALPSHEPEQQASPHALVASQQQSASHEQTAQRETAAPRAQVATYGQTAQREPAVSQARITSYAQAASGGLVSRDSASQSQNARYDQTAQHDQTTQQYAAAPHAQTFAPATPARSQVASAQPSSAAAAHLAPSLASVRLPSQPAPEASAQPASRTDSLVSQASSGKAPVALIVSAHPANPTLSTPATTSAIATSFVHQYSVQQSFSSRIDDERGLDALALATRASPAAEEKPAAKSAVSSKSPSKATPASTGETVQAAQSGAQSGPAQLAANLKAPAPSLQAASAATSRINSEQPSSTASRKLHEAAPKLAEPVQIAAPKPAQAAPLAQLAQTTSDASAVRTAPVAAPRAVPFAHEADADASLHVALLPQAAHLRMDVDGAGNLDLHLRLRDGIAHVTVSGPAAPLVEARSSDLRQALTAQGLSLGNLEQVAPSAPSANGQMNGQDLSQDRSSSGQHDPADSRDERAPAAPGAAARSSSAFTISRSTPLAATTTRDARQEIP